MCNISTHIEGNVFKIIIRGRHKNGHEITGRVTEDKGCWECTSLAKDRDGYIRIAFDGKDSRLHRYIYALINGEIPAGLCILHSCDNPSCSNPQHLSLGTVAENCHQKIIRGRNKTGKKLTDAQKRLIQTSNKSILETAREFSCSHKTVINLRKQARESINRPRVESRPSMPREIVNEEKEKASHV
jgi:hypothetical protein